MLTILVKTIMQGTVKRGRPYTEKEDIRKWTGLEFAKSKRAVENRAKWSKLAAKSSVMPQRPLWLKDRWR